MTYAPTATAPFYHGTRADLAPGDLLSPGHTSNYADRKLSWIYFSGTLDAAIWGCELARGPEGQEDARERIYLVEPTGAFEDDPNLTDSDARRPAGGRSSTKPSPATRPGPTARANRCAWSARWRPGSRTRPSASPR